MRLEAASERRGKGAHVVWDGQSPICSSIPKEKTEAMKEGGTADKAIQQREGLSICRHSGSPSFALLCYLALGIYGHVRVRIACMYSR